MSRDWNPVRLGALSRDWIAAGGEFEVRVLSLQGLSLHRLFSTFHQAPAAHPATAGLEEAKNKCRAEFQRILAECREKARRFPEEKILVTDNTFDLLVNRHDCLFSLDHVEIGDHDENGNVVRLPVSKRIDEIFDSPIFHANGKKAPTIMCVSEIRGEQLDGMAPGAMIATDWGQLYFIVTVTKVENWKAHADGVFGLRSVSKELKFEPGRYFVHVKNASSLGFTVQNNVQPPSQPVLATLVRSPSAGPSISPAPMRVPSPVTALTPTSSIQLLPSKHMGGDPNVAAGTTADNVENSGQQGLMRGGDILPTEMGRVFPCPLLAPLNPQQPTRWPQQGNSFHLKPEDLCKATDSPSSTLVLSEVAKSCLEDALALARITKEEKKEACASVTETAVGRNLTAIAVHGGVIDSVFGKSAQARAQLARRSWGALKTMPVTTVYDAALACYQQRLIDDSAGVSIDDNKSGEHRAIEYRDGDFPFLWLNPDGVQSSLQTSVPKYQPRYLACLRAPHGAPQTVALVEEPPVGRHVTEEARPIRHGGPRPQSR
ncbi:hypothetical protein BDK51DRAFT_40620 [Blyttiomyces helicus]|uniref:Uncharacterized protein n=1 Tax=Blyttiomyces helicus TaxID=388810 RepID=A0A4P9W9N0_9FUNG|nr:hypothetical protein BDK51DRAFT_40620 [Blyttiomyces helicus]|eukprot:RKO87520.1 hypothetical protein BDK51DRAFT_40620 [Blyttiomyces helicus]